MWLVPKKVFLASGEGEGSTHLNAFDAALLDAGIGNLNLVRVSSVVPPKARVSLLVDRMGQGMVHLARGAIVPVVYGSIVSDQIGKTVASALAVGLPERLSENGMIFEIGIEGNKIAAETAVERMLVEALTIRGSKLHKMIVVSSEITVSRGFVCAISAAVLTS